MYYIEGETIYKPGARTILWYLIQHDNFSIEDTEKEGVYWPSLAQILQLLAISTDLTKKYFNLSCFVFKT